jgi:hypothetical protein
LIVEAIIKGKKIRPIPHSPEIAYPTGWKDHHKNRVRIINKNTVNRNPTPVNVSSKGCHPVGF